MRSSLIAFFIAALLMTDAVMAQTINYSAKKVSLEKAISTIKQQTGYSVMYNPDILSGAATVSIDAKDMPLKEYLEKILAGNPLKYTIENKTIFIKHDHSKMNHEDGGGFHMVRIFHVTGKVTGEDGQALPLVSVAIGNTPYGGTTDKEGVFTLHEVKEMQTLTFTYMGYKKRAVSIAACCGKESLPEGVSSVMVDPSNLSLTVRLEPDVKSLGEIAIANTGYQLVSRERSSAAMTTVNEKELNTQLNNNMTTALEGKVAGVSFYRGEPAIRGTNTFGNDTSGAKPLLVIDGMITEGELADINVYDIESVTVLKDAAASSIYGARAANGVIVLTTKKGKRGAGVQINVNADHFITMKPDVSKMHYASTSQIIDYETDKYNYELNNYGGSTTELFNSYGNIGNGTIKYYSPLYALYQNQANGKVTQEEVDNTIAQWRKNDYIRDYTKYVWKNEMKQRYNISLSNAGDKTNTYVSVNYEGNQQRVMNNTSDILSVYFKNTYSVNKWLELTAGLNGRYSTETTTYDLYNTYDLQPRYSTILDANGNKVYADYVNAEDGFSSADGMNAQVASAIAGNSNFKSVKFNVLDELNNGLTINNTLWLRSFTDVNIRFSKHLKYGVKLQYEMSRKELSMQNEADSYRMRYLYNAMLTYNSTTGKYTESIPTGDRLYTANSRARNFTFRQQLDYNNDFKIAGKNSSLFAIAGMETRELYTPGINSSLIYGYNPVTLSSTLVDWYSMTENGINSYLYGTTTLSYTPGKVRTTTRHRYVSFYGNFGYTFNERYNLTGSVRVDQTDLFGTDPKYRYRPLWSVGGGWNATNEHFLQDVSWLNFLKLRATYGIGGNVDQSTSPFIRATLKSDNLFPGLQYSNVSTLPNPKLRWEKTATLNFGVDYTIFNNVLNGSIDYYRKYSSDLLATTDLDPTVGSTSMTINNGAMSNRGVEIMVNSTWLNRKDFTLASRLTVGFNRNRIEKVTHSVTDAYNLIGSPNANYYAGTPLNAVYAYQYAGMTNGYPTFYDQTGKVNVTFDATGTPVTVTALNQPAVVKLMGTSTPRYTAFFQQMAGYKGFELTVNFAYYGGHKMRKDAIKLYGFDQKDESLARRYNENNTNTAIPRLQVDYPAALVAYASTLSTYYSYSDLQVVSAASMRLRNVALAYTLSGRYCKLLHVKGLRLTAQANNLWLWTANNDDIDPETFSLNTGSRNLPTPKSYLFGAALSF